MHKIKITAPGWDAFSGDMCAVMFTNGVSDDPLPRRTLDRIAAIVPCQLLDDDGAELGQAGEAARHVSFTDVAAPVLVASEAMTDAEREAEQLAEIRTGKARQQTEFHTEDALKVIADNEGINGLRAIGDKWNVKERSINKLIFEILRAQSSYKARKQEFDDEQSKARKQVSEQAAVAEAAREAEISRTARNLSEEALQKQAAEILESLAQIERDRVSKQVELDKVAADEKAIMDAGISNAVGEGGASIFVAPQSEPEFVDPQDAEGIVDTSKETTK